MNTLQNLLDAFTDGGADRVRPALADVTATQLTELRAEATGAFRNLYAAVDRSTDDVASMAVLADVLDVLNAEQGERDALTAAANEEADALAARVGAEPEVAETTAEPVVEAAPVAETPAAPVVEAAPAPVEAAPAPVEAVAASAAPARRRVSLSSIVDRAPAPASPLPVAAPAEPAAVIVAAADVPGISAGSVLDFDGLAEAAMIRAATLPTSQVEGKHIRLPAGLIRKNFPAALVADGSDDMAVLDYAADETRLPGGSLVAAGGFCAPSETWYDLCPGLESGAGMVDLPTVLWSRGGVRWTEGPQFCDFYNGTGFFSMTEAQDIAGDFTKPCFEIPCPEFQEERLVAEGLCLTAGILQQRGYPEYVRRFIEGSLVAHAHRLNAIRIRRMETLSTAVAPTSGSPAVGATASILDSIELVVENYRYSFRMDPNRSLEAVFPLWVRGVIRSDLAKRNGVNLLEVTNADIDRWFRSRGVNPQFVYDWQDALCGTTGTPAADGTFGGSFDTAAYPSEVKVLVYAAGTFVEGTSEIITLDNVYDSAMFRKNRYTALFTEEGSRVIKRCYESLVVTIPVCPNGSTSAQETPACPVA